MNPKFLAKQANFLNAVIGRTMKMAPIKLKQLATAALVLVCILVVASAMSINLVSALEGSIAKVHYFPESETPYGSVNYFMMQTTAVNTNTTVSVSIDGEQPVPLAYQDVTHEAVAGDTSAFDWYTWQANVSDITAPGRHTVQFLSHYFVWQQADGYWAEFNAQSEVRSFLIGSFAPDYLPSPSPSPSSTTTLSPSLLLFGEATNVAVIVVGVVLVGFFVLWLRKRGLNAS